MTCESVRLGSIWRRLLVASIALLLAQASFAQKLVDPNEVAPEFRAAAEKRRAEQLKQLECARKVDEAKVPRRDRIAHIAQCLDAK